MGDPVKNVVLVGGGTMGVGIAQLLLEQSVNVVLVEVDKDRADIAWKNVVQGLESKLKHSKLDIDRTDFDRRIESYLSRLQVCIQLADAARLIDPELVIETVVEDPIVKSKVLGEIESSFAGSLVIATNTSSISIENLGRGLLGPEKFIGMHFFNPVPRSALLELVRASFTATSTIDLSVSFANQIGLEPIVVRDSPGFATSRLGVAIGLEAIRMLEEGVASAEDIDLGMMLGYKFPIGPLKLTDLVGLDVRLAISRYLESSLGSRFSPPKLLEDKVSRGELGKKSGKGFYEW
ncbi:MAG: 3-hydroxyacyl-CoA dehydrogenase family protein [Actinobacteria bacterium]|jgi:3-hydroxybutyryl-CoA dehydrogenase|nr:3-hydroxyacyl-CoA dehydrogenase family protein [Actinomycetota bacterium]